MDIGRQDQTENASAFIIAIYAHHQKLDDLSASATDLAKVLEQGGIVDAFPSGRKGGKAQELASEVKSWFAKANSKQSLILFWSGHGELESTHLYLMAQDSPAFGFDHTNDVEPSFIAKSAAL